MTIEIAILILIIVVALIFFSVEWFPADVVAIGLVLTLVVCGLVPAGEAFRGFGSDTVVMILGLLILTAALLKTGVMDLAGRLILKHAGDSPERLLLVIMIACSGLSAFMSNTASTAFFVPVVMGLAMRAKMSASKFLMPVAFASILSSSVTLISTSTNIVISGMMSQYKMEPIGMFELAPVGIPIAIVGLVYMYFIGRRLIPDRSTTGDLMADFGVSPYLSEIVVLPTSSLVGKTLEESGLGRDLDLTVINVTRGQKQFFAKGDFLLQANDVLLVEGRKEDILKIKETAGIEIKADIKHRDPNLQSEEIGLVEVIILPKSPLIGRTLKGYRFRERYGLQVLGINRHGEVIWRKLSEAPLRLGDLLLIQGRRSNIAALHDDNTVRILSAVGEAVPRRGRAHRAILIFIGAMALGTLKILPFHLSVMAGAFLVFATRCVTPEEAYREVEWKAIILIGSMLALGSAMDHTGAAKYLAGLIVDYASGAGPLWLLTGFFVLTVGLTQPMSNQAAAIVVLPVAVQTALQLGLNPRTFAMTIAIAASCSYLTPLEPSCLMVYGPGRYRFRDFLKVGSILTVVIFGLAIFLAPKIWPLR